MVVVVGGVFTCERGHRHSLLCACCFSCSLLPCLHMLLSMHTYMHAYIYTHTYAHVLEQQNVTATHPEQQPLAFIRFAQYSNSHKHPKMHTYVTFTPCFQVDAASAVNGSVPRKRVACALRKPHTPPVAVHPLLQTAAGTWRRGPGGAPKWAVREAA